MQGGIQHFWIDRKHDRIRVDLTCQVGTHKDAMGTAQVLNLSAGGLKFACSQETLLGLLPEGQHTPGLVSDVTIQVRFQLPLSGRKTPAPISCSARVIHTERLAQDSYHVGIQFLDLSDTATRALRSYIDERQHDGENP